MNPDVWMKDYWFEDCAECHSEQTVTCHNEVGENGIYVKGNCCVCHDIWSEYRPEPEHRPDQEYIDRHPEM